jgi:Flp pilus assembly protein TadG
VRRGERGAAAVEALLLAPVLLVLLALLIGGGRLVTQQAAIRGVAREAGRIAVAAPTASEAVDWGKARAEEVAAAYRLDPSRIRIAIDPGSFRRGSDVTVHVAYSARLSDLPALGLIPGSAELSASHVEPIDRYRSR